ncbi:MAG: dihydrofolate reductase family protein [Gemmatimonadales bacterium]
MVTYGAACSLDLFIAREDHAVDWLIWSDEVAALTAGFWKTIDTVVMGRKTYEVAVRSGTTAYPDVVNYLCSRTMTTAPDPRVTLAEDGVELVRRLKEEPGTGICVMGGGELAQSLLEAGLIDRVGMNLHPILLGSGIPLFRRLSGGLRWDLIESRTLKTGCVYLLYHRRP